MFVHASLKLLPPQGSTKPLKLILRHGKILVNGTTRHHEEFQTGGSPMVLLARRPRYNLFVGIAFTFMSAAEHGTAGTR